MRVFHEDFFYKGRILQLENVAGVEEGKSVVKFSNAVEASVLNTK